MISIFTTVTRPDDRGDTWEEAYKCYQELADEFMVVVGDEKTETNIIHHSGFFGEGVNAVYHKWPQEFEWPFIGEQFTRGYEACSGDWVIHCDLDFLFHQRDFGKIRQALKDYPTAPAVSFYKWQFILPDRYNLKSRLMIAVNKKAFGDRITFSGGGDLCQPQLDGKDINIEDMPQAGVPFYNYEKLTKSKEQIIDDVERMDRAYHRHFGKWLYSDEGQNAYEGWYRMVEGRFNKPSEKISLEAHPKYIQDTIKNLKPEQFGYSGFGLIEGRVYG